MFSTDIVKIQVCLEFNNKKFAKVGEVIINSCELNDPHSIVDLISKLQEIVEKFN